tara:strand:- start:194 stop:646 length:453 start_codon:yes stop_codon:yes gene_type:complete
MPVTELLLICAGVAYVSTEALKRSLKLKGKKNIQRFVSTIIGIATAWFICDGENEPTKKQLLIGLMGGSGATFLIMLLKGHLGSKNKLLNQLVEKVEETPTIKDENNNGIDDELEAKIIKEALEKEKSKEGLEDTMCALCGKTTCICEKK